MGDVRTHRDLDVWKGIFSLIERERSKIVGLIKYLRGEKNAKNR